VKQIFQEAPNEKLVERAYLVGVALPNSSVSAERDNLGELRQLATTAGAIVVGSSVQGRTRVDGATFIGSGKAETIRQECEALEANLAILDSDLSPAQARNLEKILGINVIDRTELILDIFARHAKTQQAKTQVELAQLIYSLPRLRKLWDHLSRQQGGIGTRGPGETQLEVDRRRVRERIGRLKKQLKKFEKRKDVLSESRNGFPLIALVGYTNTGKSTLMNALTDAKTLAENQLFATLDTLTRKMKTKMHEPVLIVDTVGFIRKLPHHLVESFKATLSDTARADLCLHVVDASHPAYADQMEVADRTLQQIRSSDDGRIYVFNKIDQVDEDTLAGLQSRYPEAIFISAKEHTGLDELREVIERAAFGRDVQVEVTVASSDGKTIARIQSLLQNMESALHNGHYILTGTIDSLHMTDLERIKGASVRFLF
jgi:GTP-binding protein HflX